MPTPQNEATARIRIDNALKDSGWNLLDPQQVRLELSGNSGRSDYVLLGPAGPLCVLEAKREDEDPYDHKEQARGYAHNLHAPFVILSNGSSHYFWNLQRADEEDACRIQRFPSPEDLEYLRLKNLNPPRPLLTEPLGPDYLREFRPDRTLRNYQIRAIDAVSTQFDQQSKRKFLLEMATGTGKTLLCAAMIRRFLATRNATRVLFIVDRTELVTQTMEDFQTILAEYQPVVFKDARRKAAGLLGSSVVVATIQSLMTDRRYRTEFTPFHFDLVINDEAHRSIYGDARECVEFFQAIRIGLTATPKAYLKNINIAQLGAENPKALEARELRDTYNYFGCQPGFPTFRYDIIDAVRDPEGPFLCRPKIFDIRSDITTKALEENGWAVTIDEQEENFKIRDLERRVFTPARNRLMVESFLKHAQTMPDNTLGKSIIFAVNQRHATEITKILNSIHPELAITITSRVKDASVIAKDFRDGKRKEKVAVSVDMLSTGYNCQDLLNVVLMRPIFSPTEYIQIKGRGTRLFTFKIGHTEYKKEYFFLLDFCAVAEYFEEKYDYTQPLPIPKEGDEGRDPTPPDDGDGGQGGDGGPDPGPGGGGIPVWKGIDSVISEEVRIVGPNGEKVDVLTFRGSFERDIAEHYKADPDFRQAVNDEDDDLIDEILSERVMNKPDMYYTPKKLVTSYGIPAPTPAFVYNALGIKPLPSKDQLIGDTVDSLAARFNLRYSEQKWLSATAQLIVDDPNALKQFIEGDVNLFDRPQFSQLGGIAALAKFDQRDAVFNSLRQNVIVRQSLQT
ncbi:MAG: DEAD/DEAH box helicase family protein [Phycisphaerae bacterium]